ncbi:trigger factor [Thioalkalivibrio sp. XN8]|uniref:trigger factor n=1 Tax=Thioalkalivibrio sp. XN8 TaxID=2712863 RepID=UPI0013EBC20D|nr:trigger factor [Thioalkalivibrio sp. XN8]NGP52462.1 trigger factor [Thioalkalivibrio sp. XN8]
MVTVSVESTQGLERRMTVEVPAERIEGEVDKRLQEMGRRAKIRGFRPGKAPLKVVRQQYGAQVREDVVTEVIRDSWVEAITEQKLRPVGTPRIENHSAPKGEPMSFTAVFEVFPEIELQGHEGIEVEKPVAEIGAQEVADMIEKLRTQRSHWHGVERAAADGDRVTIDFKGTIDGEEFRGGAGNEVQVTLGEGRMLPDFEGGLQGIAPGEERTISVRFPDDYGSEEVAGKQAEFQVACRKVEENHLPEVDDLFAESFGVEEGGIEKFRQEVEQNMHAELARVVRDQLKRQVLDKLVAAHEFEVPAALIEQEIEALRRDMARRMNPNAEPDQAELPPREPFAAPARFRVALGLLIGEIVRTNEIRVDADQVEQRLREIGENFGDPEAVARIYRANRDLMSQIETAVLEEQVVDWLLARAKVTDKPVAFNELMNQEGGA